MYGSLGILTVGTHVHILVVVLLLQRGPLLLANQRVVVIILLVFLKESLRRGTLRLVVVSRYVAGNVLALVEVTVMHVLFHRSWTHFVHLVTHHSAALVRVVQDVSVCNILSVYAASTLDHGKLLSV